MKKTKFAQFGQNFIKIFTLKISFLDINFFNLCSVGYRPEFFRKIKMKIPKLQAPFATFLLRVPLSLLFLQQGLNKFPVTQETAEAFGLPFVVWWFVAYGEIGSAIGLILGGVIGIMFTKGLVSELADILTRFSGITMTCVVTGVIWLMRPPSFMDVILTDYLHVSLYVGGLYFALRGNAKYNA